jgi:IclR family transcriptional regulator, pca regulon regulatory protein
MDNDSKSSVKSLAKAFRLLEVIASCESDMTLSECALAAQLDAGTTHRMLKTLEELGYISKNEGKRFTLTLKVLDLGFGAIGRKDLRSFARPILRSLVGEVSEAASLGVLQNNTVLYIERIRAGMMRLGVDIQVGTVIPVAESVIGWALLAFQSEDIQNHYLEKRSGNFGNGLNLTNMKLRDIFKDVREKGYALAPSPISNGITVLSVPILEMGGFPVAALSVTAPSVRMTPEELREKALAPVLKAAKDISRGLEASGGFSAD